MTKEYVEETINQILLQILAIRPEQLDSLRRSSCDTWTSLAQIEILFSLEEELKIRPSGEDFAFVDTRDDLVEVCARQLFR